jgi:hypothetical protein
VTYFGGRKDSGTCGSLLCTPLLVNLLCLMGRPVAANKTVLGHLGPGCHALKRSRKCCLSNRGILGSLAKQLSWHAQSFTLGLRGFGLRHHWHTCIHAGWITYIVVLLAVQHGSTELLLPSAKPCRLALASGLLLCLFDCISSRSSTLLCCTFQRRGSHFMGVLASRCEQQPIILLCISTRLPQQLGSSVVVARIKLLTMSYCGL